MPTQAITIDPPLDKIKSAFQKFTKSDYPFVYAKTLTQTAEAARVAVGIQSGRVFDLSTNFIPKNIRKSPALKSDIVNFGIGEASVFTGKKLDGWMGLHETGGIKSPHSSGSGDSGKSIALPGKGGTGGEGLLDRKFKTKGGKVKKRYKPKTLLERYNPNTHGTRKKTSKKLPFVVQSKDSSILMIVKRKSKKRYPLVVMYVFRESGKIKPTWDFKGTVEKEAEAFFAKKFESNMDLAINSLEKNFK